MHKKLRSRLAWGLVSAVTLVLVAVFLREGTGQTAVIQDVSKSQKIILKARHDKRRTGGMSVVVTGDIDGIATIERSYSSGQRMYGPQKIGPGKVSFHAGGDWYDNQCIVYYEPGTVNSGQLSIRYRFSQY